MTEHEIKNRKHDLRILKSEHRLQRFKQLGLPQLVEREKTILEKLKREAEWTTT